MKTEVNPKDTARADAFEMWMTSPMPMVTLTKTFDVSRLLKVSRKAGVRFNALLCWCIGKAASQVKEFYLLPEQDKLYQFVHSYNNLTRQSEEECKSSFIEDSMIVGTSAMVHTELDCVVNQYTDKFCNPMVMWGKYRKGFFKTTLPISFQFHHVQMDGGHGATFLELLQREMRLCCCTQ